MEHFYGIAFRYLTQKPTPHEGDYVGNDGLIHCGKCGEPREKRYPDDFKNEAFRGRTHPSMCKCEREADDKELERIKKMTVDAEIDSLRRNGLTDSLYAKFTFNDDKCYNPMISKVARNYAKNFKEIMKYEKNGIIFWGEVGTGKSFYAGCIANELIDNGISALMTNVRTLSSEMNKNFGENRADIIRKIQSVSLLILDDFGVERDTSYMAEQIYDVINERYKSGKPLIITTNLAPQNMRFDDDEKARIYDRFREKCELYEVKGKNIRKEIAQSGSKQLRDLLEGE